MFHFSRLAVDDSGIELLKAQVSTQAMIVAQKLTTS